MNKTKSFAVSLLIVVYLLGIVPGQSGVVYAQEADPVPTPTPAALPDPSPTPSPDPSPTPSPEPSTEQTVEPTPTPTPSPDPCQTDCSPANVDQTNGAVIENPVTDIADTGNNTVVAPTQEPEAVPASGEEATGSAAVSDQPSQQPDSSTSQESQNQSESQPSGEAATIVTGDAIAQVNIVNLANTNTADSGTNFEIRNIFSEQNGDIVLVEMAQVQDPSSLIVNQQNNAEVKNLVIAMANSGYNLVGGAYGTITTGVAYATVNIFNFINANLAGSPLSFAIINIFGTVNGNIVLPDPVEGAGTAGVNGNVSQQNGAQVANTVNQSSNTGNNQVNGESGSITTGDAVSVTNVQTYTNLNMLGGSFYHLIINNFGNWTGQFLGWGTLGSQNPSAGTTYFSIDSLSMLIGGNGLISGNQQNEASVQNDVMASANTGGNTVGENGGVIQTGDAYSSVNIFNFINSNIISSRGFFGIINIFGNLNGNIGGESFFVNNADLAQQPKEESKAEVAEVRAPGGQLETALTTNIGTHVNPGDTVMFYITVKNPGTGPVYDSEVIFNLYDANGEIGTIQTFKLDKLNAGEKVYVSFGLVLSGSAPGGVYHALAQAQGKVGADDSLISSLSNTSFLVSGSAGIVAVSAEPPQIQGTTDVQPLEPSFQGGIYYTQSWWALLAVLLLSSYIYGLRTIYRKPEPVQVSAV